MESQYIANNGKSNKCYEITKTGCELLALKGIGTKNNIFAARYIQKFKEIEKALQDINRESYRIKDPIERAKKWIEEEIAKRKQIELLNN